MVDVLFDQSNPREVLSDFSTAMDADRIERITDGLRAITDVVDNCSNPIYIPLLSYEIDPIGYRYTMSHGKTTLMIDDRRLCFSDLGDVTWRYDFDPTGWVNLETSIDRSGKNRPPINMLATFNKGDVFYNLSPRTKIAQMFLYLFMEDLDHSERVIQESL